MESIPVGKRTRLQRAIQEKELRDKSRLARFEARMKFRKEIDHVISSDDDDDDDDDDDEAVKVVDEEEYNKRTSDLIRSSTCPPNVDVNMGISNEKNGLRVNQFGLNHNYVVQGNDWPILDSVNEDDSDDSLQIIGERWNPLIFGDYDDIDDDSDEEDNVVIDVPNSGVCVSGEEGSQSSEDDDNANDKDFKVDERGTYSTSDYLSSADDESEETSSSLDEDYGRVRVKERKKCEDGEGGQGTKETSRGRRKKTERVFQDGIHSHGGVGGDNEDDNRKIKQGKRERKVRISKEEVFESLVSSMNPENDVQGGDNVGNVGGKKKTNFGPRLSSVKIKKGSDGVFRKVVSSFENEDDNVGGQKKPNLDPRSSFVKLKKGSDGVFRKVVSVCENEDDNVGGQKKPNSDPRSSSVKLKKGSDGVFRKVVSSFENEDDNVGGQKKPNSDPRSSSVKLKKGSDGVFRKVVSVCENEDDNVGGQTITNNSDLNHSMKKKKPNDGVLKKVVSTNEENAQGQTSSHGEEPKKKVVRKKRDEEEEEEASEKELTVQSLSKRKRTQKLTELQNTLLETILEEVNGVVEETMPMTTPREHIYLPLKFWFPVKEVEPEKSEEELESESLFKELEFGLQTCHIAFDDSPVVSDDMVVDPPTSAASENMLCAGGNHHLIHDDEIGIYCRFCPYVMLESKHVTPDFDKEIFGRAGRRDTNRLQSDDKNVDEIQIPDSIENGRDNPEPSKIIQGTVWELIPGTWRTLYPHQREGFEFIWKNVAGGIKIDELDRSSEYGVGGCIICHAPGTGKTRLAIVFIQSFLKQYPMSKPVIVAPRTMLRTWQEEFVRWKVEVPFFNLNEYELSGKEDSEVLRQVESYKSKKNIRAAKLSTWVKGKGILGISYGLYEKLANEKNNSDKRIREALINRPGLLVLDEGHTPRNDKSNIWRVLTDVLTKRKVILSGTPFQNNFDELNNTLSLVRKEFEIPIKTGSYIHDERKIEELSNKIRPFVHVHKGEILKETLKGLFSTLIVLKPSELQHRCFAAIVGHGNFALDNLVSVASVHPSIFCEQKPSFIDKEWAALLDSHREDLDAGVKTRFLVELIQLSQGERVLVFGQYLPPLNFLRGLLKSRFHWEMGRELLYMDGSQDTKERQNTIKFFNDPKSEARVLLASTKACSEGIHLVGASRVVLLDVVWNPSVERQAISRAYRLGQKKDVFVYHLITSGTIEEQKYKRQATKERLSELVFSSSEGKCIHKSSTGSQVFVDKVLEAMLDHEKMKTMFQKIVYQPKADNLIDSFGPLNL